MDGTDMCKIVNNYSFHDLCLLAEVDLRKSHESLLNLWHHAIEHSPYVGMLVEPLLTEQTSIIKRVAQLRRIEDARQRKMEQGA